MIASILHIVQRLTNGGACRSMLAEARCSARGGRYRSRIISLLPADPAQVARVERGDLPVHNSPDSAELERELARADLVQVHFWNTPELYAFLRTDLPPTRLLLRPQIGGLQAPQVLTRALVNYADLVLTSSPFSYELPVLAELPPEVRTARTDLLYNVADFGRLAQVERRPHDTFNVGYIGTLSPIKLHPDFLAMCAQIDLPGVRFILCGSPNDSRTLARQAAQLGLADRLDFRGYVEDIAPVLGELDVFGYSLCADNYSSSELVLQEAMYAGVPPVIFPYGGAQTTVQHDRTGLIVHSAAEYRQAIESLYRQPVRRRRLGTAAQTYARQHFGLDNAGPRLQRVYERLLAQPKRRRKLADAPAAATGAALFVASLGEAAPHFWVSLRSRDVADLLAADQRIAASSPALCNEAGGGIFHYRNAFPRDSTLRLWSGLALLGQGQQVRALAELRAALTLGCTHWRVSWYLAQAAAQLGARALVGPALRTVVAAAPDFVEAGRLLEEWERTA